MSADNVTPVRPCREDAGLPEGVVSDYLLEQQCRAWQLHAILELVNRIDDGEEWTPTHLTAMCAAVRMAKELAQALEVAAIREAEHG